MPRVAKVPNGSVQHVATDAPTLKKPRKHRTPRPKAFNFKARFTTCKKELVGVGKWPDWYRRRNQIDGGWYMDCIEEGIGGAIDEIKEACMTATATGDNKMQGVETLFDIIRIVAKVEGLGADVELNQKDVQEVLLTKAYATVKEVWLSLSPEDFRAERFPALQSKLEQHRSLAELWGTARLVTSCEDNAA